MWEWNRGMENQCGTGFSGNLYQNNYCKKGASNISIVWVGVIINITIDYTALSSRHCGNFYVSTDSGHTFTYFLLAFIFLSEYQATMNPVIFIQSGYYSWSSYSFSGLTGLCEYGENKHCSRSGMFSNSIQIRGRGNRQIQFLTNLKRLIIYQKWKEYDSWRNQLVLINLDF